MKIVRKYFCVALLVFLPFFGCKESITESSNNYPTTIPALSEPELSNLQNEFNANNNYMTKAKLNRYGFTGRDVDISCPFSPDTIISGSDVLRIVTNALIKNSRFTNIRSESELTTSTITIRNLSAGRNWVVFIEPQRIKGCEVLKSQIAAYVYGNNVYCIYNSWYPDAFIPETDKISASEARSKLIGQQLDLIGFYPYGSKYTVEENSIGSITDKVIFPLEKENSLELRVAYKIPVKYHGMLCWYVYMDSSTGETLDTQQIVIFN